MKILFFILSLVFSFYSFATDYNVVLITLDGVRFQEFFNGVRKPLRFPKKERPKLGTSVFPKLQNSEFEIIGNIKNNQCMKISNRYAISLPGYQSLMAGRSQGKRCKGNKLEICPQISEVTFPERLVSEAGWNKNQVAVISSWDGFTRAVESIPGTLYLNHSQNVLIDPRTGTVPSELQVSQNAQSQTPFGQTRLDQHTFDYAKWYIKNIQPRFLYIALNDADEWGHKNHYINYINTLKQNDSWIEELENLLESIEKYKGKTAIIITTDHGRGIGALWRGHDPNMISAHKIWAAVKIPKKLKEENPSIGIRKDNFFEHADIRPTIEWILKQPEYKCDGCGKNLLSL